MSNSIHDVARLLRSAFEQKVSDGPKRPEQNLKAALLAKQIHPELGPRQDEILEQLEIAGDDGPTAGIISRAIGYPQPDVYLTLRVLVALGFVEKDESTNPQRYRLADPLRSKE